MGGFRFASELERGFGMPGEARTDILVCRTARTRLPSCGVSWVLIQACRGQSLEYPGELAAFGR